MASPSTRADTDIEHATTVEMEHAAVEEESAATPPQPPPPEGSAFGRLMERRRAASTRTRILGWYVVLLGIALAAALLIQRTVLMSQVSTHIDEDLEQEAAELRQLVDGNDPDTGEPFGPAAARIFDVFLDRNVAVEGEAVVTFVNGELYSADAGGRRVLGTPIIDMWAGVRSPVRAEVSTTEGPLRFLAVPLIAEGEVTGVFTVAVFIDERRGPVNEVVRLGALVYGSIFLLASVFAWIAAGGVLRPLRDLTEAARTITDSDLSRRIPVQGNDEISELGRTFNSMLDRLEEAFDSQRQFVDDAGHELRTPITVIRGNLELMGDDSADRAATVALVTTELDRMTRIVDDLLSLAKSEQPGFIESHPVDLAELVNDAATRSNSFSDRVWDVERADEAVFDADHQRLMQALMNLTRNAVEHTLEGTPLHIGGSETDGTVRLWVRDEGEGIPAEEQGRLFDRFARGRDRRRSPSGAGLGLAIAKAIAEGHGGTIAVASVVGEGTIFTITLPPAQGPEAAS